MKRHGGLFDAIASFKNLLAASYESRRRKRLRPDVVAFHHDLESNLLDLRHQLLGRTYRPGPHRTFYIRDPKPRLISAAPYRDRVVHHALCRVIEPIFDRSFIHDCYANRKHKGTHRALDRCTAFARRNQYVLKCDLEKYFPSMDHEILMSSVSRKIKCQDTLRLVGQILDHSNPQEPIIRYFPHDTLFTPHQRRRGIPIGNLTSQIFANVYLNSFDHFVQQGLNCRFYLRYCDDFLVFADEKQRLRQVLAKMSEHLGGLRVRMHPNKCQVRPTHLGVEFLGWRVYPDHRRLRRPSGVRFQRRLKELRRAYALGAVGMEHIRSTVTSWIGHLKHGDTWGLRRKLFAAASFRK